ncbi:hypothetical protein ACHAXH_006112, partial [Discostella pseudostelligera]
NGAIDSAPSSSSPTLPNRVKSIRLSSILLYPTNVHTSVIGMRQIALQHGGQFHCVSVEELLGATADWFQNLLRRSVSYDDWNEVVEDELQQKKDVDEDHDEWTSEDIPNLSTTVGNNDATENEGSIPCKTIWLHHLLVLPLECNFGGDRFDWSNTTAMARKSCVASHYLHWSDNMRQEVKESKTMRIRHKWHILLDTAKAAATSPVHLPTLAHGGGPDFAVVSFYKLFGTPTGLGALLIKRQHRRKRTNSRIHRGNWKDESMDNPVDSVIGVAVSDITSTRQVVMNSMKLERGLSPRHYFGGGSVDVVLPEEDFVSSRNAYVAPLTANQAIQDNELDEDEHIDLGVLTHGTQNFRSIAQLIHGFREIDDYGGMEKISMHSASLATELVRRFKQILHVNGKPVVEVYGWKSLNKSFDMGHGPTVAFNILGSDGSPVGCDEVSKLAAINSPPIQLRTGCFCNPGACQSAIKLSSTDVINNYWFGNVVCGDQRSIVNGMPTGAVRASFGKDSTWEDMDALVRFVAKAFVSCTEESHPRQSPPEEDSALHQTVTMQIDSLFVFPIKSCAAMRVNRWPVGQIDCLTSNVNVRFRSSHSTCHTTARLIA